MPDTYLGSLANLAQIAKKKKPVTPAVPTATPAVAPPVTEESIKANLGIPVMGGIDPAYLAARGGVPSTTTAPVVPTVSPAVSPTYTIQPRPISDKVLSLLSDYTRQMRQAPLTAEDIMESPEYEAMRKVNELELGRGLAALSRRFSALGTLRGTPAMQTMGSLTAEAKTQLGSLVPQLVQSAYSRQQQNLSNTMNALKTLAGLEETAYGQGLSEFSATAPYRYETVAGQRAAEQFAQQFPLQEAELTGVYKGQKTPRAALIEAQTAQARASATKTGTKETDYKQTFIQNAYKKLMNGEPLTDDERRALNLDTAEKDVVAEAVKLAQNDPAFEDASEQERAEIIQRYVNMVKKLRGQSAPLPAARADTYLGVTDGMTDEEIYRVFGQ
ncbi:MAG: hypothetical protein M0R06_24360 [Sphaerochaeta sp.]|jgi:hypothetical protein|nr:hypothetical protein [Sphaerochaeta sp.]